MELVFWQRQWKGYTFRTTTYPNRFSRSPRRRSTWRSMFTARCAARRSGIPSPRFESLYRSTEITDDLQFRSTASVSGRKGLRVISYESERWTHHFLPKDSDDGMKLVCSAAVFDSPPMIESVPLEVYCTYQIIIHLKSSSFAHISLISPHFINYLVLPCMSSGAFRERGPWAIALRQNFVFTIEKIGKDGFPLCEHYWPAKMWPLFMKS